MEIQTFFLYLIIILMSARLLGEIAAHLGIPSVIGEIMAGILLGPSILGLIEPHQVLMLLAEIGVILLLFEVGLDTNLSELVNAGGKATIVAIVGFVSPFLLGFGVSYSLFHLDLLVSLFIGGTLTATSIGITIRVLSDLKRQHSPEAQIVLGAAVLDDLIGIILLSLLYEFSVGGGVTLGNSMKVLLFVTLFMAIAPPVARFISFWIKRLEKVSMTRGVIPTTMISLVLFFAWLAHAVGAPQIMGGFAAGLALSRRFVLPMGVAIHNDPAFAAYIGREMKPIIHLFTPLFFVAVGLSINFRLIDWSSSFIWSFSSLMLLCAIVGKFMGAFLIKENIYSKTIIGMAMVPRGEVGLIFAELGRTSNIFNNEVYAAMLIVIAATTIFTPFAMKRFYAAFRDRF